MPRAGRYLTWLFLCFVSVPTWSAVPELLLLKKYRPGMDVSGWYMSEKLDGVRAYWDGQQLLSRQGRPLAAPDWFIRGLPQFELDGELWIARGRFEETLSIVSKAEPHPGWRRISYNIFEAPHSPGGLKSRLSRVKGYLERYRISHVRVILQNTCLGTGHLMSVLHRVDSLGGEGLVLRNPAAPYETGRTLNAIKAKLFDDMEGRVIGYRAGKGKYIGMIGALWVEIDGGKRFYIGSGLSDRDRTGPPAVGSLITFRFQGITRNGIPRFASYLRVRESVPGQKK
jgi:DNA ligase 1